MEVRGRGGGFVRLACRQAACALAGSAASRRPSRQPHTALLLFPPAPPACAAHARRLALQPHLRPLQAAHGVPGGPAGIAFAVLPLYCLCVDCRCGPPLAPARPPAPQLVARCPTAAPRRLLPRPASRQLAHDAAAGLAYLHPSVVHRDLKPQVRVGETAAKRGRPGASLSADVQPLPLPPPLLDRACCFSLSPLLLPPHSLPAEHPAGRRGARQAGRFRHLAGE